MKLNNKGGAILWILVTLALAVAAYKFLYKDKMNTVQIGEEQTAEVEIYEELAEPEGTPEEINNDSLEDMDGLMLEIDATAEEDLSDF